MCKERGLRAVGKTEELRARLRQVDEQQLSQTWRPSKGITKSDVKALGTGGTPQRRERVDNDNIVFTNFSSWITVDHITGKSQASLYAFLL